jgi:hypothetical protein
VTILKEEAKISKEEYQDVIDYVENNQVERVTICRSNHFLV